MDPNTMKINQLGDFFFKKKNDEKYKNLGEIQVKRSL